MTYSVGMASCPSKLVRVPVQSNVQRLSQLQMSGSQYYSDVVLYFVNSFYILMLRGQILLFILSYLLFCLRHIHHNANVVFTRMFSDCTFS